MSDELVERVKMAIMASQASHGLYENNPDVMARAALRAVQEAGFAVVPSNPSPLGPLSNPICRFELANGDMFHLCGEDIIKSGMWEEMLAAAKQENTQ